MVSKNPTKKENGGHLTYKEVKEGAIEARGGGTKSDDQNEVGGHEGQRRKDERTHTALKRTRVSSICIEVHLRR